MKSTSWTRPRGAQTPLETYLREITQTPLLSAREEQQLAHRIAKGDAAARDHLTRANLRLVVNLARRFRGRGLDLPDLVAEGNLGLLRAVELFDPELGMRFSTYASYWIRQSMQRALESQSRSIRLPTYIIKHLTRWWRAQAALEQELRRAPREEEVADRLGLSFAEFQGVRKALRIYQPGLPRQASADEAPFEELFQDQHVSPPDAALIRAEELHRLQELLNQVGRRDAAVLRLRFGLEGEEPLTLDKIGGRLGLTRERVRQIETRALAKLRARVLTWGEVPSCH